MSENYLAEIIRYKTDEFKTPNIYGNTANNTLLISCEHFRVPNKETELFLFVSFENILYLPIWFEFRSTNINLLFLIEEFEVDSFELLQKILNSSLKKEEKRTTEMKAIVYHAKKLPDYMHRLTNFKIEAPLRIDLFETI